MIVQENYKIRKREFIKKYSDANRYVVRDDIEYTEANDPAELGREYVEGREIDLDDIEALKKQIEDLKKELSKVKGGA